MKAMLMIKCHVGGNNLWLNLRLLNRMFFSNNMFCHPTRCLHCKYFRTFDIKISCWWSLSFSVKISRSSKRQHWIYGPMFHITLTSTFVCFYLLKFHVKQISKVGASKVHLDRLLPDKTTEPTVNKQKTRALPHFFSPRNVTSVRKEIDQSAPANNCNKFTRSDFFYFKIELF